jgi:hypothetical protein
MAACGCGGRKPAESEQHELYRTIQKGEAAQDVAAGTAAGSPYVNPIEVARTICESSETICKAAKRSGESDAKERCRRAQERCDAAMKAATGH